ncbi:hypothetical protein M513_03679 [Trichuris suis]|uniref:Uncharacterized protein n=1 Tax=Trichuris suis TaxID=68888 RepID=A0A085MDP3_9BILA|nr:hypothetical protein M513_03679 [Trichuris suis]
MLPGRDVETSGPACRGAARCHAQLAGMELVGSTVPSPSDRYEFHEALERPDDGVYASPACSYVLFWPSLRLQRAKENVQGESLPCDDGLCRAFQVGNNVTEAC